MKKSGLISTLLKFFTVIVILWIGFLLIAAILTGGSGDLSTSTVRLSFIFSLVFGVLVTLGLNFNKGRRLQTIANKLLSDITVQKNRSASLLEKANKVVDKYTKHESDVQTRVAKENANTGKAGKKRARYITDARQFGSIISTYPELKANESIMKLLQQLEQSENAVAAAKLEYNNVVAEFNSFIHSSASIIIGRIAGFKDLDYYNEQQDDITDEELGI